MQGNFIYRNLVLYISAAFMFGCVVPYVWSDALLLLLVCGISIGCVSVWLRKWLQKNFPLWILLLCVVFFAFGIVRSMYPSITEVVFLPYIEETVSIRGVVASDIEHRYRHSRYEVMVTHLDGESVQSNGKVLVYEDYPTQCVSGEEIFFEGYLQHPENFITPTGREFNYRRHLHQQGVYAISFIEDSACVGYTNIGSGSFFTSLREILVQGIHSVLPQKEGALLGGLLLGLRGNFSPEVLEYFRITGLIHIIVLSGYNVTLVAEAVRRLTVWFSPLLAMVISLIVVVGFVLLSGAQTAAVRAGGMGAIALIARATYREYDGLRALFLIAALMTLYNPDQLMYSTSFHMSFLATIGLLLFSPLLEQKLWFITDRFQIRSIIAVTTATQLFLLPYLAYAIGAISLIGFLANILVLPLIPIAMLFGVIVAVVGIVSPLLASFIAPLAYVPLHIILFVTEVLAHIPYASLPLLEVSGLVTIILYIALTILGYKMLGMREKQGGES